METTTDLRQEMEVAIEAASRNPFATCFLLAAVPTCATIAQQHIEAARKEAAIGFAEWIEASNYYLFGTVWSSTPNIEGSFIKISELYDLYLQSKTNNGSDT